MKCIEKITSIALISLAINAYAGWNGPTAHSRANCAGFNESVTWSYEDPHYWRVESHHYHDVTEKYPTHHLNTGTCYGWRVAAYHATEAYSSRGDKWYVVGYHFYYPERKERLDVTTLAYDCNIYDGWWDR